MAAALNEHGVPVASHDWRPVDEWYSLDAGAAGALWWNDRAATPSGETVSVAIGPAAQRLLAGISSGGEDQSGSGLVARAAEIFTGKSGLAGHRPESLPSRATGASAYAVTFQLGAGREFEIVLSCVSERGAAAEATSAPAFGGKSMGMLLKVEVPVTISLGKASLPLKETLKLTRGSVVELDRTFNDPVEIVVNGRVVARGDIVVVEDKYAVRIREIHREESGQIWPGLGAGAVA
jgi:flagellar motor switch protein FliN/FliY